MSNTPFSAQEPTSIQKMFNRIAGSYDKANSILSLGIHLLWKKKLASKINFSKKLSILDCATGTGDLAFLFEKKSKNESDITGIDFSQQMLEVAQKRAHAQKSNVKFQFADIENLPFSDQQFDVVSISFGIRNVRDTQKGIKEMARVLKPGGKLLILEFGQPSTPIFSQAYQFYSQKVLPTLGGLVSGEKEAYSYLNQSSEKFPCGKSFIDLANKSFPFSDAKMEKFSAGIAYLYTLTT